MTEILRWTGDGRFADSGLNTREIGHGFGRIKRIHAAFYFTKKRKKPSTVCRQPSTVKTIACAEKSTRQIRTAIRKRLK